MQKSTTALATPFREQLDSLALFEPVEWPVVSLYLDLRPDQHGRDHYAEFLRKAIPDRIRALKGDARVSLERDAERISKYIEGQVRPAANGLAIFACSAVNDFFQAVQLEAPIEDHWLFIGSVPHLYPLARVIDQYPRYGAVLVDTNSARLFVFSLGTSEKSGSVTNVKTRKTSMGGWSQARYQRHAENFHLHHMKEVVAVLDRMVRDEKLERIVVACDQTAKPRFMEQLPQHLADKIVDVMSLDINTPEHQVLAETMESLRQHDAATDVERVEQVIGAWAAGGLGVVGPEATLKALAMQQVEELLITAAPERLRRSKEMPAGTAPGPVDVDTSSPRTDVDPELLKLADDLVTGAHKNGARVRFIEDPELLNDVGGVGALLRFKI
jgi:peptide subunit release factor 1 (eRF1)